MKTGTISSIVTNQVTLGDSVYANHLTLTASGGVEPTASGATAILSESGLAKAKISNAGTVIGGTGTAPGTATEPGQFGGNGIELSAAIGKIVNSGLIEGGASAGSAYASGGMGIKLDGSGTISNTGTITGGDGYAHPGYFQNSYLGAVGIDVAGAAKITNSGLISGGSGLRGMNPYGDYNGSSGAAAVIVGNGSSISNSGTILGGLPGFPGNYMASNYTYSAGGAGGAGVIVNGDGTLINHGLIEAGASGTYAGFGPAGYAGVQFSGAGKVTNTGIILGGGSMGEGGTGVALGSGTVSNSGTIGGGYHGGAGVTFAAGGTLTNSGDIYGSTGGVRLRYVNGGAGVDLAGAGSITNRGTITGGVGGGQHQLVRGNGGAGVILGSGTLKNYGTIAGGAAVGANHGFGNGGAGVYLGGGTLENFGTISGGLLPKSALIGASGDAVQFGTLAARLVVHAGASFDGLVVANADVNDILALAGSGGTLVGLGSEYTGFSVVTENIGADWSLSGSNTLGTSTTLRVHGQLSLGGTLTDTGLTSVTAGGGLTATNASVSTLGSLFLDDGTVNASAGSTLVIGQTDAGAAAGVITIDSGASLGGDGTIASALANNGSIVAVSGTLAFLGDVTGTGNLRMVSGAAVTVATSLADKTVSFDAGGTGILALATGASVSATLMSFSSGDTIQLQSSADSLSFSAGTLTLSESSSVVDTFTLAGDYLQSDFHLTQTDTGTDVTYSTAAQDIETHHMPLLTFWHL